MRGASAGGLVVRALAGLLLWLALPPGAAAETGSWRALMSPGPVGVDHAAVGSDCDQCHLSFAGVPDEID